MTTPQMAGANKLWTVDVGAQSASFKSGILNLQQYGRYALQMTTSSQSSLNCSITVEATVDGVNWATVPGSAVVFTTNTSYIWDNFGSGVVQARLSIAFTGGSALFYIVGFAKV